MIVPDDKAADASRFIREALQDIVDAKPYATSKCVDAMAYALELLDPKVPHGGERAPLRKVG